MQEYRNQVETTAPAMKELFGDYVLVEGSRQQRRAAERHNQKVDSRLTKLAAELDKFQETINGGITRG